MKIKLQKKGGGGENGPIGHPRARAKGALLSLDRRIRVSAEALGVEVWPPDSQPARG